MINKGGKCLWSRQLSCHHIVQGHGAAVASCTAQQVAAAAALNTGAATAAAACRTSPQFVGLRAVLRCLLEICTRWWPATTL